jgi:hypothetical protein
VRVGQKNSLPFTELSIQFCETQQGLNFFLQTYSSNITYHKVFNTNVIYE